jgi:hypothetical protein
MSVFYYPARCKRNNIIPDSTPHILRQSSEACLGTAELASQRNFDRRSTVGRFYTTMAALALVFSLVAFAPSLINPATRKGPISPLAAAHGILCVAWLVLFVAQTRLASRNLSLHRRIGTASTVMAAFVIITGYSVTIAMGRRGYDLSGDLAAQQDPLAAMGFPLLDLLMFLMLFVAGFLYRHRSAIHKRLMLLATFAALMPAPITHLTGHFAVLHNKIPFTPILVALFLIAGALHDLITIRRIHLVFLWIPLAIFAIENVCFAKVFPGATWHHLAAWLVH